MRHRLRGLRRAFRVRRPFGRRRPCAVLPAALALGLGAAAAADAADRPPRVVATIRPLHALAAGVMAGVARPHLLIEGAASPHAYALRPSDARHLAEADLVIWVGPALESFLVRPLASLAARARSLELEDVPGMRILPARSGARGRRDPDPHLWLDPRNAIVAVGAVADVLSALDPENRPLYAANAGRLREALRRLDRSLAERLASVRNVPFATYHDAYRYFETRYGLRSVGSVAVDPDRRPGIRHLRALRRRLAAEGARCLFVEPGGPPPLVATLVRDTAVRVRVVDPLGLAVAPGPGAYATMMRGLADSFRACLSGG